MDAALEHAGLIKADRDMMDDAEYEQRIEQRGCPWLALRWVQNLEEGDPGFAYSVGIPETLGRPELIVFGLDARSYTACSGTASPDGERRRNQRW